MAQRSMVVAATLGLVASAFVAFNGDESAFHIAHRQPMKLAAMEGLYVGQDKAPIVAMGMINMNKKPGDDLPAFYQEVKVPGMLSLLANRDFNSFVPGINDLVYGNPARGIVGAQQRMVSGKIAVAELGHYKTAKQNGDAATAASALALFNQNKEDLGYGYLNAPEEAAPPVGLVFYAFHIMVGLGTFFPLIFLAVLFFAFKGTLDSQRWLWWVCFGSLFLG